MSELDAIPDYIIAPERAPGAEDTVLPWDSDALETPLEEAEDDGAPIEDSVQSYLREIGQVQLLTADPHFVLYDVPLVTV